MHLSIRHLHSEHPHTRFKELATSVREVDEESVMSEDAFGAGCPKAAKAILKWSKP